MKRWFYLLIVVVAVVQFVSCGRKMPGYDLKIFNYNQASGVSSLDPAFASLQSNIWVVNQLYNGLVQVNSALEIQPCIARSWSVSDDGLTYTFILRDDVFFQDDSCFLGSKGRKLVAADVVYSFKRLIDPATAAKGAWVFNDRVDDMEPFKAIDDTTFQLKLRKPFPAMMGILTMQYCSIVPHEAVEKYGKEFRNHPVGTGPFRFSFWKENEMMVLLRNPNYFEKDTASKQRLPYLDGIRISFLDSKATEFLKFKLHELDLMVDLDAGVRDEVLTKTGELQEQYRSKFILKKANYLNTEYIGVDLHKAKEISSPLADARVRRAINFAINKHDLVTYLRNGIGLPATNGIVSPGIKPYDDIPWHGAEAQYYNPDKAKQLLKEAGYSASNPNSEIALQCNSANEAFCVFIAEQLKQVGMNMRVETMQGKALNEQMVKGNSLFFKASWIADYPDAESFLTMFYSHYSAPPNYTRFANAAYDSLYDEASNTISDSSRNVLYRRMDEIIIQQQPVIPLYYDETLDFIQNNIKGFEANPLNLLILKNVKKND